MDALRGQCVICVFALLSHQVWKHQHRPTGRMRTQGRALGQLMINKEHEEETNLCCLHRLTFGSSYHRLNRTEPQPPDHKFPRWPQWSRTRLPVQKTSETWAQSLGWEDPLEEARATHFSILAWRIPRTEELCRLQYIGSQRAGHN